MTDRRVDTLLALRRRRLEAGELPLGWKLGFGSPVAMAQLGTAAPLVGFLTHATLLESGSTVSIGGWTAPALEPELALTVGEGATIAAIGPAIEIADVEFPPDDAERILACDIFHRGVVLGEPDPGRRDAAGISVRVHRGGEQIAATDEPEALTGRLEELLRVVADAVGDELRPGDVVIAGSTVPPVQIRPGDEIRVEIDPLGALELRFS